MSTGDLEPLPPPDANYFVRNAEVITTVPSLLKNRCVSFTGNLAVRESTLLKLFR